jgi:hypothetical protein
MSEVSLSQRPVSLAMEPAGRISTEHRGTIGMKVPKEHFAIFTPVAHGSLSLVSLLAER